MWNSQARPCIGMFAIVHKVYIMGKAHDAGGDIANRAFLLLELCISPPVEFSTCILRRRTVTKFAVLSRRKKAFR